MRLIHYSRTPLTSVYSREHMRPDVDAKTSGLWVSVEGNDDWLSWCQGEGWGLDGFANATEVMLTTNANVKIVSGTSEIDDLTEEFQVQDRGSIWHRGLDWTKIRARWKGLIIAPYCWERRLSDHAGWYYGWDCASGVIWDSSAVASLQAIEPPAINAQAA